MTGIALCHVHALASAEVSCPIGPDQTDAYLETIFDRILHNEIVMNEEGEEGAGVDVSSVALYSKPRKQGYLSKKGHGKLSRSKKYWVVLKGGALMLLDKPPALNAKPVREKHWSAYLAQQG
eukprot:SAG25_NODE_16_length_24288_cov_31.926950_19_plen_122_part_00